MDVESPTLEFDVPHYDFTKQTAENRLDISNWFGKSKFFYCLENLIFWEIVDCHCYC